MYYGTKNALRDWTSPNKVGFELELPLYHGKEPVSVYPIMLGISKENQQVVRKRIYIEGTHENTEVGTFHPDNALLELTTAPTGLNQSQYVYLSYVRNEAMKFINSYYDDESVLNYLGVDSSATKYSSEELSDEYHWIAGCSPSLSTYSSKLPPIRYRDNVRYGGLHVNVDFDHSKYDHTKLVQLYDLFLGLDSVIYSRDPEADRARRALYGRAGEYRLKDFGVEYRTLPASYVGGRYTHLNNVQVEAATLAHKFSSNPPWVDEILKGVDFAAVEAAINNVDKSLAMDIQEPIMRGLN